MLITRLFETVLTVIAIIDGSEGHIWGFADSGMSRFGHDLNSDEFVNNYGNTRNRPLSQV